ncbi:MAG: oligosaccharide flippase family protein [Clostridiales bacterium]|nr:oligosaccharide flippase family protein [Clostridiales bacterium]
MGMLEKYKNMPVQAKASIWYAVCNFFQKGISFIVVPIYIRLLTTGEYGEWNIFQSWRDILIVLASLNLYAGVYTKTLVDNKNDRDRYTSSMQGLGTLITIGLLAVYVFTRAWVNPLIGLNTPYMLLLFLYFIVYPAFSFWGTRQRVEYKYKSMVVVTAIVSLLTPALSLALFFMTELRELALVLGFLIVQCAIGIIFYVYHFIKGKCFFNKGYWKYAVKFNVPLIPHYLSLIVLGQSDKIMIKYYCGESDAGIYSFPYQIASAINVLITAINGSRVPWMYEQLKAKIYDRIGKITNMLILLMGGIVTFIALLAPEIMLIGTADYEEAVYVIPVVTLGVFFTFIYDLYASIEFYYGSTKYVMYASVTGAVLNIILNAIFLPVFGYIAAAYTTLICYIIFMLMHYLFARKVIKEQNISTQIYNNKMIFLFSAVITIVGLGCMATYLFLPVRILLIAAVLIAAFILRKKIIGILKSIKK